MAAPTQTQVQPDESRELRCNLRETTNQIKNQRHDLAGDHGRNLIQAVENLNQYQDKITKPRDQAIDAEAFAIIADAGHEFAVLNVQGGKAHAPGDLLRRLRGRFVSELDAEATLAQDPDAFNWSELGQLPSVAVLFCTPPVVHHMLGPMDAQPRQKRQIQRQARRKLPTGEAVRPEEVADLAEQEKQETDRNMEEMWRVLSAKGGRVRLLDLCLNTRSFAQTTENLFTLSFMVRDARVKLEPDEEEGMMVQKLAGQGAAHKGHEKDRLQFVVTFDMDVWEQWKKAVPPGDCLMPHRKELHAEEELAAQRRMQEQRQRRQEGRQQTQQQQQQQDGEEEGEEEEEEEGQRPRGRGRRQSQQQRRQEEEEGEEEEREDPPRRVPAKRRQSGGRAGRRQEQQEAEEEEEEARPPSAKRRQSAGRQQQAQQQQQQGTLKVKPEPQYQQRRGQQQAQQAQQQEEEVIVISSDSDVVVISDSEASAPPSARRPANGGPANGTQQTGPGTSGRRLPMRGKRSLG